MTRAVNAALLGAALLSASRASAQVLNALQRQAGIPAGLALPVPGVAVAEEPAAIGVTPAAAGLVGGLALQYFHEGDVTQESAADGAYAAAGLGPLGIGYSIQWVRPGEPELRRYRENTLALALGDRDSWSLGVAWNRFSSAPRAANRSSGRRSGSCGRRGGRSPSTARSASGTRSSRSASSPSSAPR